jgi:hypothetical protein
VVAGPTASTAREESAVAAAQTVARVAAAVTTEDRAGSLRQTVEEVAAAWRAAVAAAVPPCAGSKAAVEALRSVGSSVR